MDIEKTIRMAYHLSGIITFFVFIFGVFKFLKIIEGNHLP